MPPEVIIVCLVVAAIVLMADVARSNGRCSECDHCRRLSRDQSLERRKRGHATYHMWATGILSRSRAEKAADDCRDPHCPGVR